MEQDKTKKSTPSIEFAEGHEVYIDALVKAWSELDEITKKEREMAFRKAKLNETVDALKPLVFKQSWDINTLTLSNAVRFVFSNCKRSLGAMDVRAKLEDLGYNLEQLDNPLASIHTAIKRMVDTNELYKAKAEGKKKEFEAGPELKSVETHPPEETGALHEALKSLGLPEGEAK